jgi:uncharacterized membrane protein
MNVSAVIENLKQLGRLYGALLEEEKRRLDAYLGGDLVQVEDSRIRAEYGVDEVRRVHAELNGEFQDTSLQQIAGELSPEDRQALEQGLSDLDQSMRELRAAIRRNRRYLQNSLAYTQAVTQSIFAAHPSYDGEGIVRTEGRSLHKGMRA